MEDLADDGLARLAPLDHVAYRSFAHEDYGVEGVCEVFERLGWDDGGARARADDWSLRRSACARGG